MVGDIKNGKKRRIKLNYISFVIILSAILLIIMTSFYLLLEFKTGDFVYNKDTGIIGEIRGISLPLNYLIQWQDGSFSQESLFDIEKLSRLNNSEIETILKKEKEYEQYFYPGQVKGKGIISEEVINTTNMNVLEILRGLEGKGNFVLLLGDEKCKPNFVCSEWSECQTVYGLNSLVSGELVSALQYRYCKDYSGCITDFFDSRRCEMKISVYIKKIIIGYQEYINIYNEDNVLVSRLSLGKGRNKKLDIQILIGNTSYFPYCYDGQLNYDEDETDCVYKGDSCPLCREGELLLKKPYSIVLEEKPLLKKPYPIVLEEKPLLKKPYPIVLILLVVSSVLLFMLIVFYLVLLRKSKKLAKGKSSRKVLKIIKGKLRDR